MEFAGKTAVITGGNSGIGLATAKKLSNLGCQLIIVARDHHKLNSVKLPNSSTLVCDISKYSEIKKCIREIMKSKKKIDFLINNAGCRSGTIIDKVTEETLDQEINTNLKGTLLFTKECLPLFKNGGAIVNVSSVRGRKGSSMGSVGYAATKAAIINLTKSMAIQLAKYNIRANAVAPGAIYPTGMSRDWDEEKRNKIINANILKRLGTPEDVANTIYFLLSDLSSYINGHTIDINGGDWTN